MSALLCPDESSVLAIQCNASHTTRISKHDFIGLVNFYPNLTGHLGCITLFRPNTSVFLQKTTDDWKKYVMRRIEALEDNSATFADSQTLRRLSNRANYCYVTDTLKKHNDELSEIRKRIGPLHESVVRLRLEATRGSEWGKSKTIVGLYDIFAFVASGLEATVAQRKKAAVNLYTCLVSGFQNWNYNPSGLELNAIDFNSVIQILFACFSDSC
jgi:hypothetical protein